MFIEVETTVVVRSQVSMATPSLTLISRLVVSVWPTATRLAVGWKTRARMAVVACAAVPLKVYTPLPADTKPLAVRLAPVNEPLAATSSATITDIV